MKQLQADPWTTATIKYPVAARVKGRVVSLTDYGAFVELEQGVEGLIHVSEMSWSKKVKHPSKILTRGPGGGVPGPRASTRRPTGSASASSRSSPTPGSSWPRSTRSALVDQGQGPQPDRVRRLRRGRGGDRRPDPHLRPLLDEAHQAPFGGPQEGRHRRGGRPQHRRREPAPLARPQAARHRHLGRLLLAPPGRRHRRGQGRAPHDFGAFVGAARGVEGLVHVSELDEKRIDQPEEHFKPGDFYPMKIVKVSRGREEDRALDQGREAGGVQAGPRRYRESSGSDRSTTSATHPRAQQEAATARERAGGVAGR